MALPNDPDNMNIPRAEWAEAALSTFMGCTGTDQEDAISDLLADLMHLCDRTGPGFDTELERARGNYQAEIGEGC